MAKLYAGAPSHLFKSILAPEIVIETLAWETGESNSQFRLYVPQSIDFHGLNVFNHGYRIC
jgi:hypothetical protein